jgi:hypothetical protein
MLLRRLPWPLFRGFLDVVSANSTPDATNGAIAVFRQATFGVLHAERVERGEIADDAPT